MAARKKDFVLTLTKDELAILKYIVGNAEYDGEPLKDLDWKDDERDPYDQLPEVLGKINAIDWKDGQ